MAIQPLAFGKNLRPSTVDAMNKINEVITAVNALDPSEIDTLQAQVSTLQTQMSTANGNISTLQGNVSNLQSSSTTQQEDIDNIKVTLYTPLSSNDSKD